MFSAVMFEIRAATMTDVQAIRRIYRSLNRPKRRIRVSEYLVAVNGSGVVGCAAVRRFRGGGYLYGLAVDRSCQRLGVGSRLTVARIERVRDSGDDLAIVMAMFWNVSFFRRLGFRSIRRDAVPSAAKRLGDFRNPVYKHSAILCCTTEA
jgi:N-acetylglutamate synthase-like GNAT family acetyltransferase